MNEDTLQNTYTAAIRDMIEDAEEIMMAVKESAGLVMEPENRAALERIEQEIIDLQNAVLELHKAKQQRSVTAADYAAQIKEYSQRMQELEAQQAELQTTENRYGEVKMWLDSFAEHIQSGAIMDADDSMIMKQLVEQIIVGDDGIEVHFKCGIVASHECCTQRSRYQKSYDLGWHLRRVFDSRSCSQLYLIAHITGITECIFAYQNIGGYFTLFERKYGNSSTIGLQSGFVAVQRPGFYAFRGKKLA